jgi:putative transposase
VIKSAVTKKGKNLFGLGQEGDIWQRRFWEHVIRDEQDFRRHLDYLHWNPVKHGYVKRVIDWPYSTFHRFVRPGIYPADWGGIQDEAIAGVRFGE